MSAAYLTLKHILCPSFSLNVVCTFFGFLSRPGKKKKKKAHKARTVCLFIGVFALGVHKGSTFTGRKKRPLPPDTDECC